MKKLISGILIVISICLIVFAASAASLTATWADGVVTLHCGSSGYFQVIVDGSDTGRWLGTGRPSMTWQIPEDNEYHTASLYSVSYGTANVTFFAGTVEADNHENATDNATDSSDSNDIASPEATQAPSGTSDGAELEQNDSNASVDPVSVEDLSSTEALSQSNQSNQLNPTQQSEETILTQENESEENQKDEQNKSPVRIIYFGTGSEQVVSVDNGYVLTNGLHDLKSETTMDEVFEKLGTLYGGEDHQIVIQHADELLNNESLALYDQLTLEEKLYFVTFLTNGDISLLGKLPGEHLADYMRVLDVLKGLYGKTEIEYDELVSVFFHNNDIEDADDQYMTIDLKIDETAHERYVFVQSETGWILDKILTKSNDA